VAALIDVVLMLALFAAFAKAIGTWDLEGTQKKIALYDWDFALYVGAVLLYFFAAEALTRRTVGKAMLGLRVVAATGAPATTGQVLGRTAMRLIDFLPALYLLGLAAMLAGARNARLGDLVAKTAVVRRG
jgi:uncharacterized RDD family membrane protein YckC